MKQWNLFFKVSAVLWLIWGAVHILAGVMTDKFILEGDIAGAIGGIADAVDSSTLAMEYPPAAGAVIGQHGFNLLWIGITTLICAFFVWKGNAQAIFLAALTGGLADLGYFLFMDLGGYVNFVPGTVMTLVSGTAIILSLLAHFKRTSGAT
ncbi:MAG: hypothetical protein ACFB10_23065 [Salibacteraceae bacterium]